MTTLCEYVLAHPFERGIPARQRATLRGGAQASIQLKYVDAEIHTVRVSDAT